MNPTIASAIQRPRPTTTRRPDAFSLIELVMVITIIAILAAIAVPRYANALARYRADAAAGRIVADLDVARRHAVGQSASVSVEFQPDADLVHLSGVPNPNDPQDGDWQTHLDRGPYHADLLSADFAGATIVTFDGYGYPDSGGSVVLHVGTETRTVALSAETGKAVVQ